MSYTADGQDLFLASFAADGALNWARIAGGNEKQEGKAVAIDSNGSVVLTGNFINNIVFEEDGSPDSELVVTDEGVDQRQSFVAKYDDSGDFLWARQPLGDSYSHGSAIAVAADDSIVVTGSLRGIASFDAAGSLVLNGPNSDSIEAYVARYDADGDALEVATICSGSADSVSYDLLITADGSLGVSGEFSGEAVVLPGSEFETTIGSPDTGLNGFVLLLDQQRELQWVRPLRVAAANKPRPAWRLGRMEVLPLQASSRRTFRSVSRRCRRPVITKTPTWLTCRGSELGRCSDGL